MVKAKSNTTNFNPTTWEIPYHFIHFPNYIDRARITHNMLDRSIIIINAHRVG